MSFTRSRHGAVRAAALKLIGRLEGPRRSHGRTGRQAGPRRRRNPLSLALQRSPSTQQDRGKVVSPQKDPSDPENIPHDDERGGVATESNPAGQRVFSARTTGTKSARVTLSRWRHGFEPRRDYKRKAPRCQRGIAAGLTRKEVQRSRGSRPGMPRPTRLGPRAAGSGDRPSGEEPSVGDEERGSRPRALGPPRQMARSQGGPVGSGRRWRTAPRHPTRHRVNPRTMDFDPFRHLRLEWNDVRRPRRCASSTSPSCSA
jgi:hypothetical protein